MITISGFVSGVLCGLQSWGMVLLNLAVDMLLVGQWVSMILLIVPWIPTKRWARLLNMFQRLRILRHFAVIIYIFYIAALLLVNITALELYVLGCNETLRETFDYFNRRVLQSFLVFIVVHRLTSLVLRSASLQEQCNTLTSKLSRLLEEKVAGRSSRSTMTLLSLLESSSKFSGELKLLLKKLQDIEE